VEIFWLLTEELRGINSFSGLCSQRKILPLRKKGSAYNSFLEANRSG